MKYRQLILTAMLAVFAVTAASPASTAAPLKVICTFSDFASIANEVGGDLVDAEYLSQGTQDPHFVAPKPSLAMRLRGADLFVCTGMDLEVWANTLLDKARNKKIMDGAVGYVTVSTDVEILEKPTGTVNRSQGDVHISGNPHFHTSPVNWRIISRNILTGLIKVDPANAAAYTKRQQAFEDKVERAMFGDELVDMLGGDELCELVIAGTLFDFLDNEYDGAKLSDRLGGWMKKAQALNGREVVAYHKNWAYIARDFGFNIIGFIEPKPGIPPTPKHVEDTINLINDHGVDVMLVASYFEKRKPGAIAERTGIQALFLPLSVEAIPEATDNFALMNYWINTIVNSVTVAFHQ